MNNHTIPLWTKMDWGKVYSYTLKKYDAEHPTHGDRQVRKNLINLNIMKKIQSLTDFRKMYSEYEISKAKQSILLGGKLIEPCGTPTAASAPGGVCVDLPGIGSGCATYTSDTDYGGGQISYGGFKWVSGMGC